MPYDPSLDEELFAASKEFETTRVRVAVYSYNGGEKKLQLGRENLNREDQWQFAKLGRLTKNEIEAALPLIQDAITHL